MYLSPHLQISEVECPCCHSMPIFGMDGKLIEIFEEIREKCGFPLRVNSGFRCVTHNKEVGGAKNSFHLKGMALDLSPVSMDYRLHDDNLRKLRMVAQTVNVDGGVGLYKTFTHIDTRGQKIRFFGETV